MSEEDNQDTSDVVNESKPSSFPPPPSISKKSPYQWTANEVAGWIESLDLIPEAKKFSNSLIDGSKLFGLDRVKLQNDIKIYDVTARNKILKEIIELKKQIKELHKTRVDIFASQHTRKEKNNDDSKTNDDDNPNNRKYIKIKRNNNSSDIGSNYNIENILKHFDFKDKKEKDLFENIDDFKLIYCSINKDKKKSVFMFIISNLTTKQYFYLFTKNLELWNIENTFEFIKNISNHKFVLFADEIKRKKIDGKKLIKYDRKKLQNDYGNYFDSTLRKKMLDEINLIKKQMLNNDDPSDKDQKPKTFHSTHKRTKSEIERDRIKRQKYRKAGPRDSGNRKIKYDGTKYDDSKDKAFLEDSIHPSAKDEKFQKRKKKNPAKKKETVKEIGKIHNFKGTKYDDSKDAGFLADRVNPLSKDERFQKRKEKNPAKKKETVSEIGTVKNFKGTQYDDSNDSGFLADRVNPLSKDERFQKRKEENPLKKKATVKEIGTVHNFKGTQYDDSNDSGFLADRIHPLSKDERFQKRKEANPTKKKETVNEIGTVDYDGTKYDDSKDGAFLSDEAYYRQRSAMITQDGKASVKLGPTDIGTVHGYQKPEWTEKVEQELRETAFLADKIKKEDKDYEELAKHQHKAGAVEVGKIKDFDAINYKLTEDDLMGGFLKERRWYDSSQVNEQFDEAIGNISHILKSIPAHKLRVMDNVPLPTGVHTKIVWLKKLRELIEDELKNNNDNNNDNDGNADDNDDGEC